MGASTYVRDKYAMHVGIGMGQTAVVTGCSSGIGFETALELGRAGFSVLAGLRNMSDAAITDAAQGEGLDVRAFEIDVANSESVRSAASKILSSSHVDVLVNNAGYGLFGCTEDVPVSEMRAQFETNFFGAVELIQQFVPGMRAKQNGRIINISSVAGRIGFPGSPAYVSSKFALEGLSECMRYELEPHGIQTIIIEPGVIKTKFMDNIKTPQKKDTPYTEITDRVIAGIKMMAELGTPASEVAKTIVKAATDEAPQMRYIVGNDASMFLEAKKSMSDTEFEEYIKKELY